MPIDQFSPCKRAADGLNWWCRPCRSSYSAAWRKDHIDSAKASYKRWYESKGKFQKRRPDPTTTKWWRDRNRDKVSLQNRRSSLRRYGLLVDDFDRMLAEQDGSCAICGTDDPGGRGNRFHVDHCHVTGRVRGLLCTNCNGGLGKFKDDIKLLREALAYLEKHT